MVKTISRAPPGVITEKRRILGPVLPQPDAGGAAPAQAPGAATERKRTLGPTRPSASSSEAASVKAPGTVTTDRQRMFGPVRPPMAGSGGAVCAKAVAACRAGELPKQGWSSKWSSPTKRAALLAALQAAQMHVVYALRPRSSAFQDSTGSAELEQSDLDQLLREHATGKWRVRKINADEAIHWLLEEGASLEALCSHPDVGVRTAGAKIVILSGEGSTDRVKALLASEDWRARATAAQALGQWPDLKAAEAFAPDLAKLLEDDEALVRMVSVSTLGTLGAAAAQLCAAALGAKRARVREAAAEVLGRIGTSAAPHAGALAELLADTDWQVPTAAATALRRIGIAAVPYCADMLSRCGPVSRPAVAEALSRLGGPEAADAAAKLFVHEDASVRKHAVKVVGAVGLAAAGHQAAVSSLCADEDKDVRKASRETKFKLGFRPDHDALIGEGDPLPEGVSRAVAAAATGNGAHGTKRPDHCQRCSSRSRSSRRPRHRSRGASRDRSNSRLKRRSRGASNSRSSRRHAERVEKTSHHRVRRD